MTLSKTREVSGSGTGTDLECFLPSTQVPFNLIQVNPKRDLPWLFVVKNQLVVFLARVLFDRPLTGVVQESPFSDLAGLLPFFSFPPPPRSTVVVHVQS